MSKRFLRFSGVIGLVAVVFGVCIPIIAHADILEYPAETQLNFISYTPGNPLPSQADTSDFSFGLILALVMFCVIFAIVTFLLYKHNKKSYLHASLGAKDLLIVLALPLVVCGSLLYGANKADATSQELVSQHIDVYVNTEGGPVHYGEGSASNVQVYSNNTERDLMINELTIEGDADTPFIGNWKATLEDGTKIFDGTLGDSHPLDTPIIIPVGESFEVTWSTDTNSEDLLSAVGVLNVKLCYKTFEAVQHTVAFESNGGSDVDEQKVYHGYSAYEPADPIKEGNEFVYWAIDESLEEEYDFSTPVVDDITIYAKGLPCEAYAVIDSSNQMTFYYDAHRSERASGNTSYDVYMDCYIVDESDKKLQPYYGKENPVLVTIDDSFKNAPLISTLGMFAEFSNCTTFNNLSNINTSQVKTMNGMFVYCSSVESLEVTSFNTSAVEDMGSMFDGCSGLNNLDFSNFDTNNVLYYNYMLSDMDSLHELAFGEKGTLDLEECGLKDIRGSDKDKFDVYPLEEIATHVPCTITDKYPKMVISSTREGYNVEYKTNFYYNNITYEGNEGIDGEYIVPVDMVPFEGKYYENSEYFWSDYEIYIREQRPLVEWYGDPEFNGSNTITIDSSFKEVKLRSMCAFFYGINMRRPITGLENIDTSNVTNMDFCFCYGGGRDIGQPLPYDLRSWDTSNVTSMQCFWYNDAECVDPQGDSLDITGGNTSKVTNMEYAFAAATNIIGIETLDTSAVTDMAYMFRSDGFGGPKALNLSNFNTSSVTDMTCMFIGCEQMAYLDLSNFDTSKVEKCDGMFNQTNALTKISIGNNGTLNMRNCELEDVTGYDKDTGDTYSVDTMHMHKPCTYVKNVPGIVSAYVRFYSQNTPLDTMEFRYDANKSDFDFVFDCSDTGDNDPIWTEDFLLGNYVKSISFNENFSQARPKSCAFWFKEFTGEAISGLEYLNTSEAISITGMFFQCESLKKLDLSNFDTSNLKNWGNGRIMFWGTDSLNELSLGVNGKCPLNDCDLADGPGYNKDTGEEYTPKNIPLYTAATYVTEKPTTKESEATKGSDITTSPDDKEQSSILEDGDEEISGNSEEQSIDEEIDNNANSNNDADSPLFGGLVSSVALAGVALCYRRRLNGKHEKIESLLDKIKRNL